ncbi:RHS repeat domain-containing protein [Roseivirga sp.]|uniref:RHS repeat domain-containing protein n=1 Tax=Roseivirga sp. TaxID=1964215 RepID=UPI003B51CA90
MSKNIDKAGFIYVYVSNESNNNAPVYFDDFRITHTKGEIIQEDHYYPFGLSIAALSSRAPLSKPNNYNTFQGQERTEDFDLGWYQFKWRNHDPAIGRFFNIDPLAEEYLYNSPYAFSENHITSHVELEGLEKISIKKTETARKTEAVLIALESSPATSGGLGFFAGWTRRLIFGGVNMIESGVEYTVNEIRHEKYSNDPIDEYPAEVEQQHYETTKLKSLSKSIQGGTDYLSAYTDAMTTVMGGLEGGVQSSAVKAAPKLPSVATPYGDAVQSLAPNAMAARSSVSSGQRLYRIGTTGRSQAGEAQFWALENPLSDPQRFSKIYGIPVENIQNANFIEIGRLQPGTNFITRPAPAAPGSVAGSGGD